MAALFETIQLWIRPDIVGGYHLGLFGIVGEFLFFFTANHGEIDSLGDDGTKVFFKYRLISAFIIAVIFALFVPIAWKQGIGGLNLVVVSVAAAVILSALYYHIKLFIIPDVEDGILKSVRSYNLLGIINCAAAIVSLLTGHGSVLWAITVTVKILIIISILPVMERGVKRWTT